MATLIFGFVYKYFFDALIVFVVGMFTKALIKQFGNDRADKIQNTIFTAMLWAEEHFGIGHGSEKFLAAWNKIKQLLEIQGIKLKSNEIQYVKDLMLSNVPEINSITYSALPKEAVELRALGKLTPESRKALDQLKAKYSEMPE